MKNSSCVKNRGKLSTQHEKETRKVMGYENQVCNPSVFVRLCSDQGAIDFAAACLKSTSGLHSAAVSD